MEKIKVGEYVRTEEGYIGILVEYIPNALNYLKIDVDREIRHRDTMIDNYIYTRYGFQLKHSPNIIDLIEVGDYVNGILVTGKESTLLFTEIKGIDNSGYHIPISQYGENIKSIVTKEQFAQIEYKVEE